MNAPHDFEVLVEKHKGKLIDIDTLWINTDYYPWSLGGFEMELEEAMIDTPDGQYVYTVSIEHQETQYGEDGRPELMGGFYISDLKLKGTLIN